MTTDPYRARRTGPRRLRLVTASIGAAAAVGTGALAWSVTSHDSTATTTASDSSTTGSSSDSFSSSSSLPQTSTSGSADASSGGS